MGMDVIGRTGAYFGSQWHWWHPLADYYAEIAPDIAARCQGWHHNDGNGLGTGDSRALADILQREIDSGRCEAYARIREAELAALPNDPCDFCAGAGELTAQQIKHIEERQAATEIFGPPEKFTVGEKCPFCEGAGSVEPWVRRDWSFSVENVQGFVAFLRACGGFRIW